MRYKNLNVAALCLAASLSAMTLPSVSQAEGQSIYGHVSVGYASQDWQGDYGPFQLGETWSHGHGGTVYGANLGYTFYGPFSIEGGYLDLPTATITIPGAGRFSFSTNDWYAALRGTFQLGQAFDLYAKIGVSSLDASGSTVFTNNYWFAEKDTIGPLFGAGFDYHLTTNLLLGAEYLFLDGDLNNVNSVSAPTTLVPKANVFLATLGYQFDV